MSDALHNPLPRPYFTGLGKVVLPKPYLLEGVTTHHPDPNNKNYPLCWQGVNKIESGEEDKLIIAWRPDLMTCQDCKEWIHA